MIQPPIITTPCYSSTFFFLDPGSRLSWSEKYFASQLASIEEVHAAGIALCNLRTLLNVGAVNCLSVRTSNEFIQRDAYLTEASDTFAGVTLQFASAVDGMAEMPYSTVLIREYNGSLYHSQRYMSGVPKILITDPPGPGPLAVWQSAFQAFKQALTGSGKGKLAGVPWQFLALSKDADDVKATPVFAAIVRGVSIDITVQAATVAVGDVVKVYGGVWAPKIPSPGYMLVTAVNALTNVVTCALPPGTVPTWVNGGTLKRLRRKAVDIRGFDLRGETHHKRGGRFFLPLGKSKKRA